MCGERAPAGHRVPAPAQGGYRRGSDRCPTEHSWTTSLPTFVTPSRRTRPTSTPVDCWPNSESPRRWPLRPDPHRAPSLRDGSEPGGSVGSPAWQCSASASSSQCTQRTTGGALTHLRSRRTTAPAPRRSGRRAAPLWTRPHDGRAHVCGDAQEIATLPALPPGAEYPEGVPKEPAPAEPVMAETGTGAVIADFTWLCAWETEYLTAKDANAYERVLIAERALNAWADFTPFPAKPQDAWTVKLLAPVGFDDPSGVRADRPNACARGRHLQSGPVAAFTPGGSPCRPTAGAATAPSSWPSQSRR